MGATTPRGMQERADKSLAQLYGKPVASGQLAFAAVDALTPALVGGFVYVLCSPDADCFIAIDTPALANGSSMLLPAGTQIAIMLGPPGASPVLHAIQRAAPGVLFFSRMDDVG